MKSLLTFLLLFVACKALKYDENDVSHPTKPFVDGAVKFTDGSIHQWSGPVADVYSPIYSEKSALIGKVAQMGEREALEAVETAKKAWDSGRGVWPQMPLENRIESIQNVVAALKERRSEIVNALMWEICKNSADAAAEFDRTMAFVEATIAAFREMDVSSSWKTVSGIYARVRRAAIGIMLCLGPFNYPFNETYATLIPALLAGNVVIMKIPSIGGLAHVLTMEAYSRHLPPGVINFVSGSGRATVPPIMRTGSIDVLAFIGGSSAADQVIKEHPHPHRLKTFLQLDAKNLGIVMPDADLATAVDQVVLGSTSYNGQRCTAIKLVMVHESVVGDFLPLLVDKVSAVPSGLPWVDRVLVTPLAEGPKKISFLQDMIADAVTHGAQVVNDAQGGGHVDGNLMKPAIVYPVTSSMRLWHEEQFGPVIPVAVYNSDDELLDYLAKTPFGQQAAIFTSRSDSSALLLDTLSTVVGRININTQCGRSPDSLPFSGRRSSALGTMSVTEAIEAFSIEVVVAAKATESNTALMRGYEATSKFLRPLRH